MDWLKLIDTSRVLVFSLVFARVSGIVIMTPVFGAAEIPMRIRALFAFALALLIMPSQWFLQVSEPASLPMYVLVIAAEVMLGLAIGVGLYIFFTGLEIAGEIMGHLGGLNVAQFFDPASGENMPLLSQLLYKLGLVGFICAGGVQLTMMGLLDTFQTIPPGGGTVPTGIGETMLTILCLSFNLAFRAAAPVMVGVLISMLVIGLLGRTMPQMNLMSIGFGVNTMAAFLILSLSVNAMVFCFQDHIVEVVDMILRSLHTSVRSDLL
jgi:flagellar biosynthetic protein FliR